MFSDWLDHTDVKCPWFGVYDEDDPPFMSCTCPTREDNILEQRLGRF